MTAKLLFLLLIQLCLFNSCTSTTNNAKQNDSVSKKSSPLNCYRYANSKDTITLKLVHVGNSITGTLAYKMPQKNTSKGTILGGMDGDLLVVDYTPFVDSMTPRQVVLKLIGSYFVEGKGETYTDNGRVLFKNRNDLHFNDTIKLTEFVCQ